MRALVVTNTVRAITVSNVRTRVAPGTRRPRAPSVTAIGGRRGDRIYMPTSCASVALARVSVASVDAGSRASSPRIAMASARSPR